MEKYFSLIFFLVFETAISKAINDIIIRLISKKKNNVITEYLYRINIF